MSDENLDVINRNIINGLSSLGDQIRHVGEQTEYVSRQIESVSAEQETTRARIDGLYAEFQEFVLSDQREKQRQFAQTRIIEVRQEIEKKFGHYDTVRRHATGILQAKDAGIVRKTTIETASEELMLDSPRYWLAPGLVALSSWISGKEELAKKALDAGLRVNSMKMSLFFALVTRRAGRGDACGRWLVHYFHLQSPTELDREVVVMLDSMVNGVFGGAALRQCSEVVDLWLEDLQDDPGFVDRQRTRWSAALELKTPKFEDGLYPTLREYSPTWPQLESSLAGARRNPVIHDFFDSLFTGELAIPRSLEVHVDDLLTKLVTDYDTEELPLKGEELRLRLIVEEAGDTSRADHRFAVEGEALNEKTDFAAMLTNAAMHPELSGASRGTQRFAVARSRDWILEGFHDLTAQSRARVPHEVDITAGSWSGKSTDGTNEADLVASLNDHYADRITQAVEAVKITIQTLLGVGAAGLIGAWSFVSSLSGGSGISYFGLLLMAGAGGYYWYKHNDLENVRRRAREELEAECDRALAILRAALAELVDYRREFTRNDNQAATVTVLLNALDSQQMVLRRPEQSRTVLN